MRQLTHFIYYESLRYAVFEDGPATAPPLVMLHGFGGSHRSFDHLIPALSPHFRIIRPDLAGHGRTRCFHREEAAECAAARQCAGLHHILKQLELPVASGIIYGYSMGGRLALQYALRYAGKSAGSEKIPPGAPALFVIESGTYGIADSVQRAARRREDALLAQQITSDFNGFLRSWNQKQVFKTPAPLSPELEEQQAQIRAGQRAAGLAASLRGFGTGTMPCIRESLGHIRRPAELWTGAADQKFTALASDMMQLLGQGKHHTIQKAGHRVHLEQPETVIKRLIELRADGPLSARAATVSPT